MKCPNCKENYEDKYEFCPWCGAKKPSEKTCPRCNFKSSQYEFCPKCGEKLLTKKQLSKKMEEMKKRRIEKEKQRQRMEYERQITKEDLVNYLNKYKEDVSKIVYFKLKNEIENGNIISKQQLDNRLKIQIGEANKKELLDYLEKNQLIGSNYIPEELATIKGLIECGNIKSISEIEQAKARLLKQRNQQRERIYERDRKKREEMLRNMTYYHPINDDEEEEERYYDDEDREREIEEIADDYCSDNDYDRWEYHDHGIVFILEGSGMYYGKREVLSDEELRDYDS